MYLCRRASRACYCSLALLAKSESFFRCSGGSGASGVEAAFVQRGSQTQRRRGFLTASSLGFGRLYSESKVLGRVEVRRIQAVASISIPTLMMSTSSNPNDEVVGQSEDVDVDVAANFLAVQQRVQEATALRNSAENNDYDDDDTVRLVAVSKTKPIELLQRAYAAGCRHFGENYVQELVDKIEMWNGMNCVGVHWHFIGTLQSNKCNTLVKCMATDTKEGIEMFTVETISSENLAKKLNNAVMKVNTDGKQLKVFVQVNTSGEESKGGVEPGRQCIDLCRYIAKECPGLLLRGLMTIGAPGDQSSFGALVQCRKDVTQAFRKDDLLIMGGPLELSMGMSGDFEQAIAAGATNVRVGSTIFGDRIYSMEPLPVSAAEEA